MKTSAAGARLQLLAISAACIVCISASVVTALYSMDNRSGAKAWQDAQRRFPTTPSTDAPIPDDQNLAMAPYFVRTLAYEKNPQTGQLRVGSSKRHDVCIRALLAELRGYNTGKSPFQDLRFGSVTEVLVHPELASRILEALKPAEGALAEIEAALPSRPRLRFPIDPTDEEEQADSQRFLCFAAVDSLGDVLRLRASAKIAQRDGEGALHDLLVAAQLTHQLMDDPNESMSLGWSGVDDVVKIVHEGIAARCWDAAALERLQSSLGSYSPLAELRGFAETEIAAALAAVDKERTQRPSFREVIEQFEQSINSEAWETLRHRLAPSGCFDRVKAAAAISLHEQVEKSLAPDSRSTHLGQTVAATISFQGAIPIFRGYTTRLARVASLPKQWEELAQNRAWTQAGLEFAAAACALERRRLETGSYPDTLDGLIDGLVDPIGGGPLHYRRDGDGYVLYFPGSNGRDADGVLPSYDEAIGNRVWKMPPRPAHDAP